MRPTARPRQYGLKFNITPMIDIIFNLLIFFVVTSHFKHSETAQPIELPEATQIEQTRDTAPHHLVVTITADEKLTVGAKEVDEQAIEQMIIQGQAEDPARFEVLIRGDRTTPYRRIQPLLLSCARTGVKSFKFAVLKK